MLRLLPLLLVPLLAQSGAQVNEELREVLSLDDRVDARIADGRIGEAISLSERSLTLKERHFGAKDRVVAVALHNLAFLYKEHGQPEPALKLLVRADDTFAYDAPERGPLLVTWGEVELLRGHSFEAEGLAERARRLVPDEGRNLRLVLLRGRIELEERRLGLAEPLLDAALRLAERERPADVPNVLDHLSLLRAAQGDFADAERIAARSLSLRERALPGNHPSLARSLAALANLHLAQDDGAGAEPYLRRAVDLLERAGHGDLPMALHNLAAAHARLGQSAQAEAEYRRALKLQQETQAGRDADISSTLNNLSMLAVRRGDLQEAEALLGQVLRLRDSPYSWGWSPHYARAQLSLGVIRLAQGKIEPALDLIRPSLQTTERRLRSGLLGLSAARLASALDLMHEEEQIVYTLALEHPEVPRLRLFAASLALLRKGRSIDEAAETSRSIYLHLPQEDRDAVARLQALRGQLAGLSMGGGAQEEVERLREEAERLEQALSRRVLRGRRHDLPMESVDAVVGLAIPRDAALLEIVAFRAMPVRQRPGGPRRDELRYLGFLLFHVDDIFAMDPQVIDLGSGAELDALARRVLRALSQRQAALREEALALFLRPLARPAALAALFLATALRAPDPAALLERLSAPALARRLLGRLLPEEDYEALGQELYERVLGPVAPRLGGRRRLLLSTDGELNLVPFAALHDGRGFAGDTLEIGYLTSGRDLLPRDEHPEPVPEGAPPDPPLPRRAPGRAVVVLADPQLPPRARGMAPLPGTRAEAEAVRALHRGAQVYLGAAASEGRLLQQRAPRILHVATHGVFLADAPAPGGAGRGVFLGPPPQPLSPLLRSYLVLAAPPKGQPGEDGLVTALEIAGMDLHGTGLVVLSACESGAGEVRLGQGVYGLRRAVLLAGAESLLSSLWRVDDAATQALMVSYHKALLSGRGRGEALGQAARALRQEHPHPYFWAPFVLTGQQGPLP